LIAEHAQHTAYRALLEECLKNQLDTVPNLAVRILDDTPILQSDIANGEVKPELSAPSLVEDASVESTSESVEFNLGQNPLHAQQKAPVDGSGIVDPITICDEAVLERAQVEERIPVRAVS